MYAKTVLTLTFALLGAASTFASEATWVHPTKPSSNLARDAVKLDTIAALKAGEVARGEVVPVLAVSTTGLSRAQVRAEAREALRLGLNSRGEHNVFPSAEQLQRIQMAGQQALRMTSDSL